MTPAEVNIMVPQGGEYNEVFTFYEDADKTVPKDLGVTGWSGKIVIRDKEKRLDPIVSNMIDTAEANVGKIGIRIPSSVTAGMVTLNHEEDALVPRYNYVYAVVVEGDTEKRWIMRGELALIPDPERM